MIHFCQESNNYTVLPQGHMYIDVGTWLFKNRSAKKNSKAGENKIVALNPLTELTKSYIMHQTHSQLVYEKVLITLQTNANQNHNKLSTHFSENGHHNNEK